MTNLVKWGLAGGGGLLLLLAVTKKKSHKGPAGVVGPARTYIAANNDNRYSVSLRFGTTFKILEAANQGNPGYGKGIFATGARINLPPGVSDQGPRAGAMGKLA